MRQFEVRKKFLTSKIPPFGVNRGQKASVLSTHIDFASAQLIVRYLSSKRPFANSFDKYLSGLPTDSIFFRFPFLYKIIGHRLSIRKLPTDI